MKQEPCLFRFRQGNPLDGNGSRCYTSGQLFVIRLEADRAVYVVWKKRELKGTQACEFCRATDTSVTPDGTEVSVANQSSNAVTVISTATNTVTGTITVGTAPCALGSFIQ